MWCPKSGKLGKGSVHFMGYSLGLTYMVNRNIILTEQNRTEQNSKVNCALFASCGALEIEYNIRDG